MLPNGRSHSKAKQKGRVQCEDDEVVECGMELQCSALLLPAAVVGIYVASINKRQG